LSLVYSRLVGLTLEEHLDVFKRESISLSPNLSPSPAPFASMDNEEFQYPTSFTHQWPAVPTAFAQQFDQSLLFPPSFEVAHSGSTSLTLFRSRILMTNGTLLPRDRSKKIYNTIYNLSSQQPLSK
jgi:hypothetical protein